MDHTEEKPILAAPAADPDREARRKQGDFRTFECEARGKQEENAIFLSPLPVSKNSESGFCSTFFHGERSDMQSVQIPKISVFPSMQRCDSYQDLQG